MTVVTNNYVSQVTLTVILGCGGDEELNEKLVPRVTWVVVVRWYKRQPLFPFSQRIVLRAAAMVGKASHVITNNVSFITS